MILDIIIKYWVEWALGLVAVGLGATTKYFYGLYKQEQKRQKNEFYEEIKAMIKASSAESKREEALLQDQINIIKSGVLSLQGKTFRQECREFLDPDYNFTLAQYEELQAEHDTYNSLGGNHTGDMLFSLVEEKAGKILTDDK